jgi:hypothetical protein
MTATFPPAIGLPQSPAVAVLLILVALGVTYALLNVFLRVGVQPPFREEAADDADTDERTPVEESDAVPWHERAQEALEPERPPELDLHIEAIRVRNIPLAVGDTASQVMRAFRPGEGERLPLVERMPGGMAARVIRAYSVDRRIVVIVLERTDEDEPLRLIQMDLQDG